MKYRVNFILRTTSKDDWGSIQLVVSHNYERIRISIRRDHEQRRDFTLNADAWDSRRQLPQSGLNKARVTRRIQELEELCDTYFNTIDEHEEEVNLKELKKILIGESDIAALHEPFLRLFKRFINEYTVSSGDGGRVRPSFNTLVTYRSTYNYLLKFNTMRHRRGGKSLRLEDFCTPSPVRAVEPKVVQEFHQFLLEDIGLKPSSTWRARKILATALKWAQTEGLAGDREVYTKSCGGMGTVRKRVILGVDDVAKIRNLDLSIDSALDEVRATFLLQLDTGLRYSDLHRLDPNKLALTHQEVIQTKTGGTAVVYHSEDVRGTLKRWVRTGTPSFVMPGKNGRMSRSAIYNRKIKLVCRLAGLDRAVPSEDGSLAPLWQMVSSHTARRSMITSCLQSGQFTVTQVALRTGHKDLRQLDPQGSYNQGDPHLMAKLLGIQAIPLAGENVE